MRLLFSDETMTPNFIGVSALCRSYQSDKEHRGEYLSALWNTAGGGTGGGLLLEFETACMADNALAREYKAVVNGTCEDDPFLKEPKLETLEFLCAAPPSSGRTLLGYDHRGVLTQNRTFLDQLIEQTRWGPESVRAFRMLLVLLLQLKQEESTVLLEEGEIKTLRQMLRKYQLAAAPAAPRIYPIQDGALYLRDGSIYKVVFTAGKEACHTPVSPKGAVLLDFAPYGEAQRVELTARRLLTETSAREVYQMWTAAGSPLLRSLACYGDICMLLRQDGSILSNVREDIWEGWRDAVWVGAGLNSVSAICGPERCLHASFPIKRLTTGVREAVTYSDGVETHYGAILENRQLVVDGRGTIKVSAVAICSAGVAFARRREILFLSFHDRRTVRLCTCDGEVQSLCVEDCTASKPSYLRLIWLTKAGVFQKCVTQTQQMQAELCKELDDFFN